MCNRGDRYQSGRQLIQNVINLDSVSVSLSNLYFLLIFLFVFFYGIIQIVYQCHPFSPFVFYQRVNASMSAEWDSRAKQQSILLEAVGC